MEKVPAGAVRRAESSPDEGRLPRASALQSSAARAEIHKACRDVTDSKGLQTSHLKKECSPNQRSVESVECLHIANRTRSWITIL